MRPTAGRRAAGVLGLALVASACAGAQDAAGGTTAVVAEGWQVEVVATDLRGPTQVVVTDARRVVVAALAGGESDGTGEVHDLGPAGEGGNRTVLLDGLDKPTGLALVGDDLWVQEPDRLLRFPGGLTVPDVVVDDLPSNGRSQGTLTLLPDGRIAFEASGTGSGPDPDPASGILYAVAPDAPPGTMPDVVATGFKGAYAHAVTAEGALWVTEVGDGRYDGEPPPDELNLVPLGTGSPPDAGWPLCVGELPVVENGGTQDACAASLSPTAVFPPRATPTSVVELVDGTVLVALWVENRVVEVDPATGVVTDVLTDVANPQHLALHPDGGAFLTVFGDGELWRLTRTTG